MAQSADAARSDRADRGSNPREPTTLPAWRKWLTRSAQTRLNASASRADSCGFESHRWDHPEGDIVEGKDAALSAREYGFESRCPRQDGLVVQPSKSCCGGKGRRPWRSHKPRNAGSIPASATNSRFVQWKDGGPTNRTRGFDSLTGYQSDGGRRQTVRRGSVKPVLAGSTPVAHPNSILRVVG